MTANITNTATGQTGYQVPGATLPAGWTSNGAATPSQVSSAINQGMTSGGGGAATASGAIVNGSGQTVGTVNPHDAIGYNPASDPTSTANPASPNYNAANYASQPTQQSVGQVANPGTAQAVSATTGTPSGISGAPNLTGNTQDQAGQAIDQLKLKYGQALSDITKTGVPSPTSQGAATAGINTAIQNQPPTPQQQPTTTPAVDTFFNPQTNPTLQQSTQDLINFLSPPTVQQDLGNAMSKLVGDQNALSSEKLQLMNMQNVMAGTPDDIRDEVTKANGFASESQVQAMAVSRNKVLLKQSSFLQQQLQFQQDMVANDTSLVQSEKEMANTQFSQRLGILNYQQTAQTNMTNAARTSLQAVVTAAGYDGLYKAVSNDPTQIARDEQVLGLAPGGLKELASSPTAALDRQIKTATLAHTLAETNKINSDLSSSTPGTQAYNTQQDKLEQQYRQTLLKEASSRSGDLGIQNQKVSQAIHLTSLLNQYKDPKTGDFNVPQAQYSELVFGLANLLSPNGTTSEGDRARLQSLTAAGDIKGALQYITGAPQNGNTQAIIKNLADSIDRQGGVAEDLRGQSVQFLQGLAPTGLDQNRIDALNKNGLPSYETFKQTGKVGDATYTIPKLLQPTEIPSGYYQASDGLLYKR